LVSLTTTEGKSYFGHNKPQQAHGRQSLGGGAIFMAGRALNAAVQVGSMLLLARLLTPEDYGLVSMVIAITGFAPVFVDLGTRDAVVQRDHITEGEISALFWITFAVGCGFALIVAAAGPFIARFYGEPRLTRIVLLSSLTFVTTALICQHHALLRRAMMFRQIAVIEVGANVLSAAGAIAMAFSGWHYWALVTRPLATSFLTAVGLWVQCRWLPARPTITSGVKEMVRFGINLIGYSMTDFVGRNSDRVAIGKGHGARGLGYYQNALNVYGNLLDLVFSLHDVAAVSLSKLRDNLPELRRLWAKALSTLAFYAMPAFGILAVTGQDLIVLLVGEKWSSAGVLLSVLALRGIPHVVERTLGWLHVAAGRTDRWMRWGVVAASVQLVALFSGLPFGPMGVAVAYVLCMYVLFVPSIAYAGRPLGIGAGDVVKVVGRPLAGALSSAALGFLLRYTLLAHAPRLERMALVALAYLVLYIVVVAGLFRVRAPLDVALSLLRDVLPRLKTSDLLPREETFGTENSRG